MDTKGGKGTEMDVLHPPCMPQMLPLDDDAALGLMNSQAAGASGMPLLLPEDHTEEEESPQHRQTEGPIQKDIVAPGLEADENPDKYRRKERRLQWEKKNRAKLVWSLQSRVAGIGAEMDRIILETARARDDMHIPLPPLSSLPKFELETLRSAAARRSADIVATACKKTLQAIMLHKWSWPFNTPVDIRVYTDYLEKVKEPIDFGAIKRKLESGQYPNPEAFLKDMRLVFDNACAYNKPGVDVYVMATTLREKFEEKVNSTIKPRIIEASLHAEADVLAARQRNAGIVDPSDNSQDQNSSPAKRRKEAEFRCAALIKDVDNLMSVISDSKSLAASLCIPLTRSEKEELAVSLGKLSESNFEIAIGIVMLQHPGLQPFDDIGFDLDMLDSLTLRQLQSFVKTIEDSLDSADAPSFKIDNPEQLGTSRGSTRKVSWPGILIGSGMRDRLPQSRTKDSKRKRGDQGGASKEKSKDVDISAQIEKKAISEPSLGAEGCINAADGHINTPVVTPLAPTAGSSVPTASLGIETLKKNSA